MDDLDEIKDIFFTECGDLLAELSDKMSALESGEAGPEDLNAIFRAVHSIKGGAGSFDLPELVGFAHTFENVLDRMRSGELALDHDLTALMMRSADILVDLVDWSRDGAAIDEQAYAPTTERLHALSGEESGEGSEDAFEFTVAPMDMDFDFGGDGNLPGLSGPSGLPNLPDLPSVDGLRDLNGPTALPEDPGDGVDGTDALVILFKPGFDLAVSGFNTFLLLDDLVEAGAMAVELDEGGADALEDDDATRAHLSWRLTFPASMTLDDINEVLFFALDKCSVEVLSTPRLEDVTHTVASELSALPDPEALKAEFPASEPSAPEPKPVSESKAEAFAKVTDAAPAKVRKAPPPTIRVVLQKVDKLINQVGELVVTQAMLDETISTAGLERDPDVMSTLSEFRQLTVEIQESVMAIRAQPIRSLFQRMGRVVRESAQSVGKNAKLVLDGEYTEIDNTMIEKLADPLTHILRNAVDHGLETPDDRAAAGKPVQGTVSLSAAHRGGKVVIEIRDDGAGINRAKVRSLAESKGLVEPSADLSDGEIDNLLFMPGFSTADSVSTLSGRGVGMDVVKRSIMDVGGKVSIQSAQGQGSCITITLPLTLAILDGMLVRVGRETLVVPLTSVVETIIVRPSSVHLMTDGTRMVDIRGSLLPLVELTRQLGFGAPTAGDGVEGPSPTVAVVVESDGDRWCALEVAAVIDQRQVVIKSLEENFGAVNYMSAATILGDGRLALILDVEAMNKWMVPKPVDETLQDLQTRNVA